MVAPRPTDPCVSSSPNARRDCQNVCDWFWRVRVFLFASFLILWPAIGGLAAKIVVPI